MPKKRESHTLVRSFVLVLLIVSFALPSEPAITGNSMVVQASTPAKTTGPTASFKWSMPKRFGPKNAQGLVDYHWDQKAKTYEPAYVNPASWTVNFDACVPSAVPDSSFEWQIDGQVRPNPNPKACTFTHRFTAQKTCPVKLTVTAPDGQTSSDEMNITVKDLLLVSIGDSVASGEGNPDKPRKTRPAQWIDRLCHRSATAGPAQAAMRIENSDPHTSVTFVSFACSGAGIEEGLLGAYKGLPPQLTQLVNAVSGRPIDALLISIGLNDAYFSKLVTKMIQLKHCDQHSPTKALLEKGLQQLPGRYAKLAKRINDAHLVTKVLITEYPDVLRDKSKSFCDNSPAIPDLLYGINAAEAKWAFESIIIPINDAVRTAAGLWGWVYVGDIALKIWGWAT
ncbi:MAG: SGNH/GDSL hydrolase family protein [Pyrinomonadaceae bacterium]